MLQPLVENALKHGIAQQGAGFLVTALKELQVEHVLFTGTAGGLEVGAKVAASGLLLLVASGRWQPAAAGAPARMSADFGLELADAGALGIQLPLCVACAEQRRSLLVDLGDVRHLGLVGDALCGLAALDGRAGCRLRGSYLRLGLRLSVSRCGLGAGKGQEDAGLRLDRRRANARAAIARNADNFEIRVFINNFFQAMLKEI